MAECKNCRKKHHNKTYCSKNCKLIGLHENNIGKHYNQKENNINFGKPAWNKGKYSVEPEYKKICLICNNKFIANKIESMSHFVKRKFCSKKCMYESLHKNNKGNKYASVEQSKERKQNTSKIMKEKFKNGELKPSFRMKSYEYKGIKFRSSWEGKFAEKCDMEGKPWEYEKHRFYIKSTNTIYIPDFYLPNEDRFIEIKGYWYPHSKRKFEAFRKEYPLINIEVIDIRPK